MLKCVTPSWMRTAISNVRTMSCVHSSFNSAWIRLRQYARNTYSRMCFPRVIYWIELKWSKKRSNQWSHFTDWNISTSNPSVMELKRGSIGISRIDTISVGTMLCAWIHNSHKRFLCKNNSCSCSRIWNRLLDDDI